MACQWRLGPEYPTACACACAYSRPWQPTTTGLEHSPHPEHELGAEGEMRRLDLQREGEEREERERQRRRDT